MSAGWQQALVLLTCLALPMPAAGQTVTALTGAVNGIVKDGSGAVMPGVSVVIASPGQMGTRETITAGDGSYGFAAVPPGEYTVTLALPGFATMRFEGVRVTLGFTATVNADMQPAGFEAQVTVSGVAPVVDIATNTVGTTLDTATLASLPATRDLQGFLTQVPGLTMSNVDVGGNTMAVINSLYAYGTRNQASMSLEGIESHSNTQGTGGFFYNFGSFEEVQVNGSATGAEMSMPGMQIRMISKSGSNQYRGVFFGSYENGSLQSYNIDADQIARGVVGGGGLEARDTNRLSRYFDTDASVGGYLKQDRVWWHSSARTAQIATRQTSYPGQLHRTNQLNADVKVTVAASPQHKFIGYAAWNREVQPARLTSFQLGNAYILPTQADTAYYRFTAYVYKAEWNGILSDRTLIEARTGNSVYTSGSYPQPGASPAALRYEDLTTRIGRGPSSTTVLDAWRPQTTVLVSTALGKHTLKLGSEFFRDGRESISAAGGYGDLVHMLQNGAPLEVYFVKNPIDNLTGQDAFTGYVTDNWRIHPQLTANLGLRFDHYYSYQPEQTHPVGRFTSEPTVFPAKDNYRWNLFAPRLGAAWALDASQRTVLKASFGQYWWNQGAFFSQTFNPNSNSWWERYAWTDANGNMSWDPGEQGRLLGTTGGAGSAALDPAFEDPYTLETTAWFERVIGEFTGVRTGFIWRRDYNVSRTINTNQPYSAFTDPVTIPDPGPDGLAGNGDDGSPLQGFNLAPEFLGRPNVNVVTNDRNLTPTFRTLEASVVRRLHRRWSVMASTSYTWNTALTVPATNLAVPAYSPNQSINAGPNGELSFTSWTAKANATWEAPLGLHVIPAIMHQSGFNYGRVINARFNFGTTAILAEPIDTRRSPNVTMMDVRVEKRLRLRNARSLAGFVDVLNLANANPEQQLVTTAGTSFLRPTQILPPRLIRMGAKVEW